MAKKKQAKVVGRATLRKAVNAYGVFVHFTRTQGSEALHLFDLPVLVVPPDDHQRALDIAELLGKRKLPGAKGGVSVEKITILRGEWDTQPLSDAEVDAFLAAHQDHEEDARVERVRHHFKKKLKETKT